MSWSGLAFGPRVRTNATQLISFLFFKLVDFPSDGDLQSIYAIRPPTMTFAEGGSRDSFTVSLAKRVEIQFEAKSQWACTSGEKLNWKDMARLD